ARRRAASRRAGDAVRPRRRLRGALLPAHRRRAQGSNRRTVASRHALVPVLFLGNRDRRVGRATLFHSRRVRVAAERALRRNRQLSVRRELSARAHLAGQADAVQPETRAADGAVERSKPAGALPPHGLLRPQAPGRADQRDLELTPPASSSRSPASFAFAASALTVAPALGRASSCISAR